MSYKALPQVILAVLPVDKARVYSVLVNRPSSENQWIICSCISLIKDSARSQSNRGTERKTFQLTKADLITSKPQLQPCMDANTNDQLTSVYGQGKLQGNPPQTSTEASRCRCYSGRCNGQQSLSGPAAQAIVTHTTESSPKPYIDQVKIEVVNCDLVIGVVDWRQHDTFVTVKNITDSHPQVFGF